MDGVTGRLMRNFGVGPRLRNVLLLAAALLHLAGAAALPVLHAYVQGAPAPSADLVRRDDGAQVPPAHDEQTCAVCHAMGTAALPAHEAAPAPAFETAAALSTAGRTLHAATHDASSLARAPPARS